MALFRSAIFFLLFLFSIQSCKKLEDLYYDPDLIVEPVAGKVFSKMLDNNRVRPSYWEIRTFVAMHTGIYTQSLAYLNSSLMYQQTPSYTQDRWSDFYRPGGNGGGVMAHFREIEKVYNAASAADKPGAELYLQAARIILYDQASQMVDLWGDIPFSEAGSLNATGETIMPKFDDAKDVYNVLINGLKHAAAYFGSVSPSSIVLTDFSKQDILLNGNLLKWQRYANSIRLRLLMRISVSDETRARAEVSEMLSDPAKFPLIDAGATYDPLITDILLQQLTSNTDNLRNALTELTNFSAPGYLLDSIMKPAGDPRIPVMFDKYGKTVSDVYYPNPEYNGLPVKMDGVQQQVNIGSYAILDSATFLFNTKLPGIVITAAEINFLKAEALERWGLGDAKPYYETALKQSVLFYYFLNGLNPVTKTPLTKPTDVALEAFVQNAAVAYNGSAAQKLSRIYVQKWVHFGFLQSVQGWSELRRTGYPQLYFQPSSLAGFEEPPLRLVYPNSETTYNPNYQLVKGKDFRTTKIFWQTR